MVPFDDIRRATECPVNWREEIFPFPDGYDDALELLHQEWISCIHKTCIDSEEAYFAQGIVAGFEPDADPDVIKNLLARRESAVKLYMSGIGKLSELKFLRPSEHGKHFAVKIPTQTLNKQSFFYRDLQERTIRDFFWEWFDDAFIFEIDLLTEERKFLRKVDNILASLSAGGRARIAVYTVIPIGQMNDQVLNHLALDIDVGVGVVHGYPISREEAVAIMYPEDVRIAKPREETRPR